MTLTEQIERVKADLRQGKFTSEASVSQGILLSVLQELGWNVFDTSLVTPEYSVENRRVDYALCRSSKNPIIFVEVKKVGNLSEAADRQLFEYAFHVGVQMAVLTDGQEWSFYLPGEQGRYDERRVYKLDMLERDTDEIAERLNRYLSYERVCSGEALQAAKSDYQNVAQGREIEKTFPKAWNALLEEPDSLLLEMLAEKVADLCGYKPEPRACEKFLESIDKNMPQETRPSERSRPQYLPLQTSNIPGTRTRETRTFSIVFKGTHHQTNSAIERLKKVLQLLDQEDSTFLERFATQKHGQKIRYLSRDRHQLHAEKDADYNEQHSTEVVPGWWLWKNFSSHTIREIIDDAIKIAGPLGQDMDVRAVD